MKMTNHNNRNDFKREVLLYNNIECENTCINGKIPISLYSKIYNIRSCVEKNCT